MFDATSENIEVDRVTKSTITRDGTTMTFAQALHALRNDACFRSWFSDLLAKCPFSAFRWETPALSLTTIDRPFEFVLLSAPGFASRRTDAVTYEEYFTDDDTNHGIVTFANLGSDATLIVPSPRTDRNAYGHLAAFMRHAPESQRDSFWRVVGKTVRALVNDHPIWLSTAGGGVAWLHVRVDSHPKYYGYSPYKRSS